MLAAALAALAAAGVAILRQGPVIASTPLGPSARRYANSVAEVETALAPLELLALAKRIERAFGRRRARRWAARVLDIDLIAWSGGQWRSGRLTIPHPACAERAFVLAPARAIAPHWRVSPPGLSIAHLHTRLTRPRPLPKRKAPGRRPRAVTVGP